MNKKTKLMLVLFLLLVSSFALVGFQFLKSTEHNNRIDMVHQMRPKTIKEENISKGVNMYSQGQVLYIFDSLKDLEKSINIKFLHSSKLTDGRSVAYIKDSHSNLSTVSVFPKSNNLTQENVLDTVYNSKKPFYTITFQTSGMRFDDIETYGGFYKDLGYIEYNGIKSKLISSTNSSFEDGWYILIFDYDNVTYKVDKIPTKDEAVTIFKSFFD